LRSGNSHSPLADSFSSAVRWAHQHLPIDHITIGVVVFIFGFFGAQINAGMGWLAFGLGILLLTWRTRMPAGLRALIYFVALAPILYWFDRVSKLLFRHPAGDDATSTLELVFRFGFAAASVIGLLVVVRHRTQGRVRLSGGRNSAASQGGEKWSNIPSKRFRDLGGMHEEKRRIARIVENRLHPERSAIHGVVLQGILLYGPRGTGKTAIAEATAGEFRINYWYINPNQFVEQWIGTSEANIRDAFARAYRNRPILLFLDEIDSIGTQRQQLGKNDDRGGAASFTTRLSRN